jgi:hypothetical protein
MSHKFFISSFNMSGISSLSKATLLSRTARGRGLSTTPSVARPGDRGLSPTLPGLVSAVPGDRGLSPTLSMTNAAGGSGLSPTPPMAGVSSNVPHFPFEAANSTGLYTRTVDSSVFGSPSSMTAGIRTGSTHPVDHEQTSRSVSPLRLDEDHVRPAFTEESVDIKDKMAQIINVIKKKMENNLEVFEESKENEMGWLRDGWFEFDEDESEFLRLPEAFGQFYIRPCYKDIYSILNETWQGKKQAARNVGSRRHPCALITGTPGIGKSVFGSVLIKYLMSREKPVLIFSQSHCEESIITFWQGEVFKVEASVALTMVTKMENQKLTSVKSHDLDAVEIWSIGDSRTPLRTPSINQVCISSPGHAAKDATTMKGWIKETRALILTIPPCDWDELIHIRDTMVRSSSGPDKSVPSLEVLKERYDMWGGVPRTLLGEPEAIAECEDIFHRLKVADAIQYLCTRRLDHPRHSGRIFHLLPGFKLKQNQEHQRTLYEMYGTGRSYWWATETMERRAWAQFRNQEESKVINFIETLSNDSASRGRAWEAQIQHLIQTSGIRGTLRNLETGELTEEYGINSQTTAFFENFDEIDSSAEYWRPVSPTHKTCDGYIPGAGLFLQMTVGKDHKINISGIENVLKSGKFGTWEDQHPNQPLRLLFIVHPTVFDNFTKQTYRYPDRTKHGNKKQKAERKEKVENQVQQYVLKVDLRDKLQNKFCSRKRRVPHTSYSKEEGQPVKRFKKSA